MGVPGYDRFSRRSFCEVGDHREADHAFGVRRFGLVVAGEATVHHDPPETPLHDPAPQDDGKAVDLLVAWNDVDVDAERGAVLDRLLLVAGVDSRLADGGVVGGDACEELDAGRVVRDAGSGHHDQQ
jgi:hypothetical protein